MDNPENWQHKVLNTKKNRTKTQHTTYSTPLYAKNTNNVNKTLTLLQTTRCKDEPSISLDNQIYKTNHHLKRSLNLWILIWY